MKSAWDYKVKAGMEFDALMVLILHPSSLIFHPQSPLGGLAQLARAPALQAGGQRFESVILHQLGIGCGAGRSLPESIFDMLDKQDCRLDKVFSTIQLKV